MLRIQRCIAKKSNAYSQDASFPRPFNFKHALCEDMLNEIGKEKDKYTKLTIVRNPWDLALSFYFHLRKPLQTCKSLSHIKLLNPRQACADACKLSFKDWVELYYNPYTRPRQSESSRIIPPPVNHFMNQTQWLFSTDGFLLVDNILKFEEPGHWFAWFENQGLKTSLISKIHNKSNRQRDYRNYYDDKSAEVISKFLPKILNNSLIHLANS